MSTYLLRRDGGSYYFRRAIPANLRPFIGGRRKWIKSLGTKSRRGWALSSVAQKTSG
ncbi:MULTISPECIES: DUF6538 domain-containing protein [unclassified Sphingobium]|uniref:DUF6538 domain-containing protein n=1 Tax=unclassified Sphingobium TaxID=2611147 RepID=UPI003421F21A